MIFLASDFVFILLINVKMPKIVGILTFTSRISSVEKSFITSAPMQPPKAQSAWAFIHSDASHLCQHKGSLGAMTSFLTHGEDCG